MGNKSFGTKSIRQYWWKVISEVFVPLSGELSMRAVGILFTLSLTILIISQIFVLLGLVSTPFFVDRIEDFKSITNASFYTFLVMSILLFIGIVRVPAKWDYEKENKIKEFTEKDEKELNIAISPSFEKDFLFKGKNTKCLTLNIYNQDINKKIIEFGVKVNLSFIHEAEGEKIMSGITTGGNLPWLKEGKEFIELRPNSNSEIIVAFLEDKLLRTVNFKQEKEGEIVLQILLSLTGKYEGENDFRNKLEYKAIYYSPVEDQFAFSNVATASYPNIHFKLRKMMNIMNDGVFYKDNF